MECSFEEISGGTVLTLFHWNGLLSEEVSKYASRNQADCQAGLFILWQIKKR